MLWIHSKHASWHATRCLPQARCPTGWLRQIKSQGRHFSFTPQLTVIVKLLSYVFPGIQTLGVRMDCFSSLPALWQWFGNLSEKKKRQRKEQKTSAVLHLLVLRFHNGGGGGLKGPPEWTKRGPLPLPPLLYTYSIHDEREILKTTASWH